MSVRLISENVSNDTLECAIHLAKGIEDGSIVGAVIGILYKRRRYSVTICGEAKQDPAFGHTACCVMMAELMDMMRGRGLESSTTL